MSTPEGKVKAQIKRTLDKLEAYYTMPATGGYGSSGVPDFVGCLNGMFFAIEAKAGGNKPTALQMSHLCRIATAGGVALVINEDNVDRLEELLVWEKQHACTRT
jgi:hypothetical protein